MSGWADILARSGDGLVFAGASPSLVAGRVGRGPVYLATPYSRAVTDAGGGWDYGLSLQAAYRAAIEMGRLDAAGVVAVSPIVLSAEMCHLAHVAPHLIPPIPHPLNAAAWMDRCMVMLRRFDAVVVPDIPGWDASAGVLTEARAMLDRGGRVFVYGGRA